MPFQRRYPTESDQCSTGKLTSRWPGTLAPVSIIGPQATSFKTMAPKPLLRIRPHAKKTFGETFGAATGVSDPRLQKIRIRNNGAGGQAATVAGHAGPGFHTWPSGHIPQDNGSETASPHPAPCQKDVRRGVRRRDWGQRPTAKIRGAAPLPLGRGYETTTQGSLLPDEGKVNETSNGRHPLFLAWSSPMVPRMP